jgi:hypothetical protein
VRVPRRARHDDRHDDRFREAVARARVCPESSQSTAPTLTLVPRRALAGRRVAGGGSRVAGGGSRARRRRRPRGVFNRQIGGSGRHSRDLL